MNNQHMNSETLKAEAGKVTQKDIKEILRKRDEILEKSQGPLTEFIDDIKLLFSLIDDYFSGFYTSTPWMTIATVVFTLLYILNPFDIVPDFIPLIGLVDDAACLALCLAAISSDLEDYKQWKQEQKAKN